MVGRGGHGVWVEREGHGVVGREWHLINLLIDRRKLGCHPLLQCMLPSFATAMARPPTALRRIVLSRSLTHIGGHKDVEPPWERGLRVVVVGVEVREPTAEAAAREEAVNGPTRVACTQPALLPGQHHLGTYPQRGVRTR